MTNIHRGVLLALAILVAAGAFLLLRPDDDGTGTRASRSGQLETSVPSDNGAPAANEDAADVARRDDEARKRRERRRKARGPLLTSGSVRKITVQSGDLVRFQVRSSTPEEVHVHGYDVYGDVEPGATKRFSFPAEIEGIFEIELHGSGTLIGELRVEP